MQLPAWNEALGLPRLWDQQWSLRAQQILAYETDLLGHADIFNGRDVVTERERQLIEQASQEIEDIQARGSVVEAVESGYLKQQLVESNAERLRAIERGEQVVVGVNKYLEGADSPLTVDLEVVKRGDNVMPPSIAAAKAGVTTGESAATLREVLGEYRAPTGVAGARVSEGEGGLPMP